MAKETLPMLDLFAGAGGLSLGLSRAGLTPIAASEMDQDALETYQNAHEQYVPDTSLELFEGDVGQHAFKHLKGNVAVVAGGPPCQPYSTGGARRGVLDERDGIPQFVRVVKEVNPDAFIMENVPGLAKGSQLPVLKGILAAFRDLGYLVDWKLIHAADYGVSQRRQRLVIVGSRRGGFEWPSPTHGALASKPWVQAKSLLDPNLPIGTPNTAKITYAKTPDLRPSPWDGHLWNGGGRPINPDGLAPTLIASMGGNKTPWLDGGDIVAKYHAHLMDGGAPRSGIVPGARRITVAEAALIQGFPADMPWSGRTSSQYRQIGNAVPVLLASAVGEAVVRHLSAASAETVQLESLAA
ncbi:MULTISPECIES: DNA cytosine methyltransferase [unclassified Leucobacter]|uniref:DNA cytosine methyltransferase n=1 Tax=unclassified Leucobacter TaxID=2621730 RepID=UPI0030165033